MLYMPVCPPGAGKSVTAEILVSAGFISKDAVISSDHYRYVLTGDRTNQECTEKVFSLINQIIQYRLYDGSDVFIDATNLTKPDRNYMLEMARDFSQRVLVMPTSLKEDEIRARNNSEHRQKLGTVVPEKAMDKMINRFKHFQDTLDELPDNVIIKSLEDVYDFAQSHVYDNLNHILAEEDQRKGLLDDINNV